MNKILVALLLSISGLAVAGVDHPTSDPRLTDRGHQPIPVWANPIVVPVSSGDNHATLVVASPPQLTTQTNGQNLGGSTVRLIHVVPF